MTEDIKALFAAKKAQAPVVGRDAVSLFKKSAQTQIKRAEAAKTAKSKTPALDWFKETVNGYTFQLGKKPIPYDGASHWEVESLDEVKRFLGLAVELADSDQDFRKAIRAAAQKNGTTSGTTSATPPAAETKTPEPPKKRGGRRKGN